jgi:hypothetical protein
VWSRKLDQASAQFIDYHDGNFESSVSPVDVVIDTVGKYVEELK